MWQKTLITLIEFCNEYVIAGEYQNFIFILSYIISLCGILYKYKQLLFNKIILILCDNKFKAYIIKKKISRKQINVEQIDYDQIFLKCRR